jgi:hypothetical protein
MAIPGSGAISLTGTIQGEFGGTTPTSMSEYLKGGTYVPNTPTNVNIKSSASNMSFSNYYNGSVISFTAAFNNAEPINLIDQGASGSLYQATYTINTAGTCTKYGLNGGLEGSGGSQGPTAWGSPTGGTPGNNYEARLNVSLYAAASGGYSRFNGVDVTSTGFTSWYSLSSNRAIDVVSNLYGYSRLIGTLYIRNTSTLAEISRSFDILADPTF